MYTVNGIQKFLKKKKKFRLLKEEITNGENNIH